MIKKTAFLILLTLIHVVADAQLTFLAESTPFNEPNKGFNKTVIMNDGTTCNLTIDKNFIIGIKTYDKDFKQIVSKNATARFGHLSLTTEVSAVFESNNQIVLVVKELEMLSMHVYRVIIDPKTGMIVKQDKLLDHEKKQVIGANLAMAKSGSVFPNFEMDYDVTTGNYVTGYVNTGESREKRNLEVKVYNNNHELIKTNTFEWGDKNIYDHIRLQNLIIVDDKVYATLLAFNLNLMQNEVGTYIIVDCSESGSHTNFAKIELAEDVNTESSLINYSYKDKKVHLITQSRLPRKLFKDEENAFESANKIFIYDPITKQITNGKALKIPDAYSSYRSLSGSYINADGSYSITYEMYDENTNTTSNASGSITSSKTSLEFKTNYIINDNGQSGYSVSKIPKNHFIKNANSSTLFSGRLEYDEDMAYKRFFYISGEKHNYLLMNDEYDNEKRVKEGKKPSKVTNLKDASAFYFNINGKEAIPTRNYLLEDKESVIMMASAYYNYKNKLFAVLKKDRKSDKVTMIWMKVE